MQNPKFSQKVHKLNDFITAAEYSLCWPLDSKTIIPPKNCYT